MAQLPHVLTLTLDSEAVQVILKSVEQLRDEVDAIKRELREPEPAACAPGRRVQGPIEGELPPTSYRQLLEQFGPALQQSEPRSLRALLRSAQSAATAIWRRKWFRS